MKVAHASDHITHAVIGGKKAVNFGISDDPAFFQILSSALYKDPLLAMIRETICNAWDVHIECGITNKAVEVTISDEYITIKDYGHGIHDDLIAPIYGIYGASTKKNDGRQTGGFGLGCKSPFAYSDHFEVTSAHNGTKTIYNMSKSSGELEGRPSITPIASFPSTETGITVKIPINPANKMNHLMPWYVKNVVFNGDIKATLNQQLLPILGLEQTEFGLVMLTNEDSENSRHIKQVINVRYGNVIYPVDRIEHWADLYDKVYNLLEKHYDCKLIMLAPPDSISITPSRESLTNSDITVATINGLMVKFLSVFIKNQQLLFRHKELVNEYVDAAAVQKTTHTTYKLPLDNWCIPGIPNKISNHLLKSTEDFAKLEVLLRYNGRKGLKPKKFLGYIQRYLYKINEANPNWLNKGLLQHWARTFQRNISALRDPRNLHDYAYDNYHYNEYGRRVLKPTTRGSHTNEITVATRWWQKKVLYPLVKKLTVVPGFDKKHLYYVSRNTGITDRWGKNATVYVGKVKLKSHTHNVVHLITPTLILCHNAEILPKRISGDGYDNLTSGTKQADTYFVYEVSRKQAELDAVKDALSKIEGIEVIDYTGRTKEEQAKYEETQEKINANRAAIAAGKKPIIRVPKKVRNGMVRLDVIWDKDHKVISTSRFISDKDPVRIVKPEAVAIISTGQEKQKNISGLSEDISRIIMKMYGQVVGISNKSDAIVNAKKKDPSVMEIREYLFDKILYDVQNLPTLVSYQNSNIDKIYDYIKENTGWQRSNKIKTVVHMLIDYPELNHLVPDIQILSEEDKMRWTLWQNMEEIAYGRRDEIRKVKAKIEAVPLKKEIKEFLENLIKNRFLDFIDEEGSTELLRNSHQDPVARQKFVELLTTTLK